jgi:hypothetical protein
MYHMKKRKANIIHFTFQHAPEYVHNTGALQNIPEKVAQNVFHFSMYGTYLN